MMYLLHTDSGNRRLCSYISRQFDSQLQGHLAVDRIEDLRLDRVIARGVRFVPPDGGPPAIEVPRVTITFSPWDALQGSYGWTHADVEQPLVRVTELPNGKTNMEELFASREPDPSEQPSARRDKGKPVALQGMVTKGAKLWIGGGSLPSMYLSDIQGIMRIDIDDEGAVLRFDEYHGKLDGLPSGHLDFGDVKGQVWTAGKRLLHFDGRGTNEGQPVVFGLDIVTKPTDVKINTQFAEVGVGSLAARMMAVWSKFSPGIDVEVTQTRN